MTSSRFATRLNSFGSAPQLFWPDLTGRPTMMQMAERAASARGLTDLDLNYPDPCRRGSARGWRGASATLDWRSTDWRCAITRNPGFKLGAFTHPDKIREERSH
jgi:xylose isomerase